MKTNKEKKTMKTDNWQSTAPRGDRNRWPFYGHLLRRETTVTSDRFKVTCYVARVEDQWEPIKNNEDQ